MKAPVPPLAPSVHARRAFLLPFTPLRRDLLALPVPEATAALALAAAQPAHHAHQPARALGRVEHAARVLAAEALAQARAHRARVQRHAGGLGAAARGQVDVERFRQLRDGGLAGPVAVPPAGPVVGDGPHARRQQRQRRVVRRHHRFLALALRRPAAVVRGELGGAPRQEGHKVLGHEQGPERVDQEGVARGGRVDLVRRLLGAQDARQHEAKAQVGVAGGEGGVALLGCGGDGVVVCTGLSTCPALSLAKVR